MHPSGTVVQLLHQGLARKTRKRTPEARARHRALAIHDKATALVAMADHGGALFYVNAAGRAILGLASDDDVSGITLIDCVAPSVRTRIAGAAIPTALSSGVWSGDCVLLAREGRQIDVSLQITAHRDNKGRLEGLSLLAQDMSARTSTAAALSITRNEMLRLSAQHMTIQENVRRRIAADLHDGLGQSLGLVIVSLENIANLLSEGEPKKAAECLDRLNPKVKDTLDELRRIAMNLRPATLDSLGILATLSWHLREIEATYPGIKIERWIGVNETDVPKSLRTPIFRILQEAGSNAITHGKADRMTVRLSKVHGVLELAIEDNGKGFDPGTSTRNRRLNRGLGLQSMRERAELSCGNCEIKSAPGKGTQVRVRWPASLRDIDLGCSTEPAPEAQVIQNPGFSDFENSRDSEMLRDLSACAACDRRMKSDG
jgi:PAS domain S-box-containing protein